MTYPSAIVTSITPYRGVWIIAATCPGGQSVTHGAGHVTAAPRGHTSTRGAHCSTTPTRRQPGCEHGRTYRLVPAPGLVVPEPLSADDAARNRRAW